MKYIVCRYYRDRDIDRDKIEHIEETVQRGINFYFYSHYIKKCLLHQVLIQWNMYIVVLDKILHLQVKMVAIVT